MMTQEDRKFIISVIEASAREIGVPSITLEAAVYQMGRALALAKGKADLGKILVKHEALDRQVLADKPLTKGEATLLVEATRTFVGYSGIRVEGTRAIAAARKLAARGLGSYSPEWAAADRRPRGRFHRNRLALTARARLTQARIRLARTMPEARTPGPSPVL